MRGATRRPISDRHAACLRTMRSRGTTGSRGFFALSESRPMNIPAAYVAVIVIWSTTPLAIKWSTQEVGFLFGAVSRMTLGFLCVYALTRMRGEPLRFDRTALRAYALAALGIYGAMFSTYWAAQHVPSGWISLIFGLSPLLTALLSALLLGERAITPSRVLAQLFGLAGLALIFVRSVDVGPAAALATLVLVGATACHALSAVLLKRQNAGLPASTLVAGGLLVALIPYYLSFWLLGGTLPVVVPGYVLASILYLGAIATTCGFTLYYFILRRQSPTQLALIAFVAPICALSLGNLLNGEVIEARVALGALLVLVALFLHEVWPAVVRVRTRARPPPASAAATAGRSEVVP